MTKRLSIRQILVYVLVLGVLAIADPWIPTFVVGCALALCGIAVRVWGCGHLQKNQRVVTSGPYAHVQHPLYLGTFLVALGAVLAAGSWRMPALLIWVVVGPLFFGYFFLVYMPKKKKVEGGRLTDKFAEEYGDYLSAVPEFVPALRAWPGAAQERWSWRNFRENHEIEMDLLIVGLFAAVLLVPAVAPWQ
jgi:protein-S-isoprenylcysteine O-methyltransferase Ste14